ncbi:uncharacterized protein LOC109606831 [Aethina tumida]|uniref:uncharacterized protein LOC109606831 n=1 Tax=Aethina tumida TaxID=116153 RepID=UPI00096AE1F3|nr:uncharacterized protein LOC109606831 [Aethina tumida]
MNCCVRNRSASETVGDESITNGRRITTQSGRTCCWGSSFRENETRSSTRTSLEVNLPNNSVNNSIAHTEIDSNIYMYPRDTSESESMVTGRRFPSTNKLLDLLSMCFWKCSPGCQQLPEHYNNSSSSH